jgi:putative acetyltransferase
VTDKRIELSLFCVGESNALADLFTASVHGIDDALYSPSQKSTWAPLKIDYSFWQTRFTNTLPWVARMAGRPVGFAELICFPEKSAGYIDCFYVHPDAQGQGVGRALLNQLIHKAKEQGLTHLTTDASLAAVPFFSAFGFVEGQRNTHRRAGEVLVNVTMTLTMETLRA